jgi:DNA repair exonuclease SbcCD nuclease subunit
VSKSEGNRTKAGLKTAVLISNIMMPAGNKQDVSCPAPPPFFIWIKEVRVGSWKKRKRTGKGRTGRQDEEEEKVYGTSKKTARSPEVEKKTGREMERILEKLEEMKVEIKEEIKEMRKENQEVKREIEQLREEFKNRERNGRREKYVWESSTAGKESGKWRKEKKKK